MNLAELAKLMAGGAGSGCQGPNCGRPPGENTKIGNIREKNPNAAYVQNYRGHYIVKEKIGLRRKKYLLYSPSANHKLGSYVGNKGKAELKQQVRQGRLQQPIAKQEVIERRTIVPSPKTRPDQPPEKGGIQWKEYDLGGKGVKEQKNLGGGINKTTIVTFADGSKAVFKPADGEYAGKIRDGIKDHQMERELAAWQVAKLGGVSDITCATIKRTIDGQEGALIEFKKGKTAAEVDRDIRYGNETTAKRAAAFDYVIGNLDRHSGNWLVHKTADGEVQVHLIDHGLAFGEEKFSHGPWAGGNTRIIDHVSGTYGNDKIPASIRDPYIENREAILKSLKEQKIPQAAIDQVDYRIKRLGRKETWGDL